MQAKVLLIGENQQGYSRLIRCLDRYRCKCRFATTYQEAVPLLGIKDFDLVLSPMRVRDSSVFPLISLLENSRTTLFYFQASGSRLLVASRSSVRSKLLWIVCPSSERVHCFPQSCYGGDTKGSITYDHVSSLCNANLTRCAPTAHCKICNCHTGACRAARPGKIYSNGIAD